MMEHNSDSTPADHPNPEQDTVAQRPTHICAGRPTTPPHPNAHHACRTPAPGAPPPEKLSGRSCASRIGWRRECRHHATNGSFTRPQGQLVDVTSHFNGEERVARHFMVAPFQIARGCTATYFPEANVLVPINSTADRSNTPTSKSLVVSIKASEDADEAVDELLRSAQIAAAR